MLETMDAMLLNYTAKVIEMTPAGFFSDTRVSFRAFLMKLGEV